MQKQRPLMRPWIKRLNELRRRDELPLTLRGRRFTYRGLRTVMRCVVKHFMKDEQEFRRLFVSSWGGGNQMVG